MAKRKNVRKGKSYNETTDVKGKYTKDHPNDWKWYVPNEQLLKDVGSLPFTNALGARDYRGYFGDQYNNYSVPGVMRINYVPTVGYSADINDPVNICARNIYSFIKSFNSRAKTYDAPDLMLYLISMDSLLTYHAWMKRLYGMLSVTSYTNRYFPSAAVCAAGGNYEDLLDHITDLRAYINNFATRIKALPIPYKLNIFKRHEWLPSGVFLDSSDTLKPQSYIFTPYVYNRFEIDEDGAGMAKAVEVPSDEMTFAQIKSFGEDLLNAVLSGAGEEDFNLIGADILYSYGMDGVVRAETIAEDYTVIPQYDSWVLDQINNIRAYGRPNLDTLDIKQDATKNYLIQKPVIEIFHKKPWNEIVMDQRVNIFDKDTSPAHIMEATRFMYIPEVQEPEQFAPDATRKIYPVACGTELVVGFKVYYYATLDGTAEGWQLYRSPEYSTNFTIRLEVFTGNGSYTINTLQEIWDATIGTVDMISEFTSFDRHPLLYMNALVVNSIDVVESWTNYGHLEVVDLNNYATISASQLRAMNEVAMLGLFGIENYGK